MKVYTYDTKRARVVERECEVFGYPNKDSAGAVQFVNTHFRTAREAAEKLVVEIEAGIHLDAAERKSRRAQLRAVTRRLADAAERLAKAQDELKRIERVGGGV